MCAYALNRMLWCCGVLSLAASLCAATPFLPAGGNVILFSGLPGDIESETAYRNQLQALLGATENRPLGGIIVLADDPKAIDTAAHPKVKIVKGDRAGWLSVTNFLGSSTNQLTVIIWGHGGNQRDKSVFHVRGPRISAADLDIVAEATHADQSVWALLFRGSGAFAREVAAERRTIISSDCDNRFDSDPIGMEALLAVISRQPAVEVGALAQELGTRTQQWYSSRNLARTEEPALWDGGKAPELLAKATPKTEQAAEKDEPNAEKSPPTKIAESPASAEDLPDFWKGIRKVRPEDYPQEDAVVLRRSISYTIGKQPALSAEQDELVQILTPEGKSAGDFDISYSPPFEEMRFLDCEVLSPDGKLSRLDPENIRDAMESMGEYQAGRRKVFSLPGVIPGAVLHVRYQSQWRDFPLPNVSLEIPIAHEAPARECSIKVSVPKDAPFHFVVERMASADPVVSSSAYSSTYTWRFKDVPAHKREVLIPPRQQSRLLISTFPDWSEFAGWYGRITQLADEVTPELETKAKELTRDAKTDHEKVVAVYNYVTALRYVAVPMGINSFRPHAAVNVFKNGFGDCKDKANLFNTLLRTMKIDSHLVLVPRFSQAHESIPGLAFNHAISRVMLEGKPLWVDTTDDVCRFGMLPPGDSGRKVLVIDGQTTSLTELPLPDPANHLLKIRGKIDLSPAPDGAKVSLRAETCGFPDYELRSTARQARDYGTSLPLLAASFRPGVGSFGLAKQQASSVAALDENFSWRAEGSWFGGTAAGQERTIVHAPFWLPKEWEMALHQRESPLFLNHGYPLLLDEEFEISLPAGVQSDLLPAKAENASAPFKWRIEWKRGAANGLLASLRAELLRGELTPPETAAFQKQLRNLFAALASDATLKRAQ